MAFADNQTLFGHDPEPGIVAASFDGVRTITLFQRSSDGSIVRSQHPFRPFLWSDSDIATDEISTIPQEGDLSLRFLVETDSWQQIARLRSGLKQSGVRHFALSDPIQQFLLRTGKTLFKGMAFADLHRMQIHLEAGAVHLTDNRGWRASLADPAEVTALVLERDPDVIEGHDLFRTILPAVAGKRAKLAWGRDGTPLTRRPSRLQIAEKTIDYPKFEANGRHLVDTALLAQFYDVSSRSLPGYELPEVAKHFHLTGSPNEQVARLTELLAASYFVQAQIFPYNFQDVIVRGNATKIDSLFLREYCRRNHSLPEPPEPRPFEGGYTDIFYTGVARNVWHCDVASLYPSIMLSQGCFPAQDRLGIFLGLLGDLRRFRLEAKAEYRRAPSHALAALQSTFKILINSFYGYLGFAQGHFADFEAASRVTQIGRDLLKTMVAWLQDRGSQVIEIDTDGIYFVPPPDTELGTIENGLAAILPAGIEVEFDARYEAMFSYKAKNYALLEASGELHLTGAALKSRGMERFLRLFLEQMIRLLLTGRAAEIAPLRAEFESKIRQRQWPIEMLMKTETLQVSLAQYQKKIAGNARNRASAYELALKSGRNHQPGDQISYYVTGTRKTLPVHENSRLVEEWDSRNRDENVEYYAAKLAELAKKFASFIETNEDSGADQMPLL